MSLAVQERLFEPFFATKDSDERAELGLATIYGILRQHGGYITCTSEPGRGTSFRVYLPRAQPATAVSSGASALVQRAAAASVLVVDDEEAVRELIERDRRLAGVAGVRGDTADAWPPATTCRSGGHSIEV